MEKKKEYTTKFLGNYFGHGPSYDGAVFSLAAGCSTTLLASNAHGNVYKFIEVKKEEKNA